MVKYKYAMSNKIKNKNKTKSIRVKNHILYLSYLKNSERDVGDR